MITLMVEANKSRAFKVPRDLEVSIYQEYNQEDKTEFLTLEATVTLEVEAE